MLNKKKEIRNDTGTVIEPFLKLKIRVKINV